LEIKIEFFGYRAPNLPYHFAVVQVSIAAVHLLNHYKSLFSVYFHREGGSSVRNQCGMSTLHCQLDVLGIVVAATDDYNFLKPPGDVQLAVVYETEISGPEVRAVTVGQNLGLEDPRINLGLVPISRSHIRAFQPYLSYLGRSGGLCCFRIHYFHRFS
jgi:hypothetical protein